MKKKESLKAKIYKSPYHKKSPSSLLFQELSKKKIKKNR